MLAQYSDKSIVKLSSDDTVSSAIAAMQKAGIKEIVIEENNKTYLVDPHRILRIKNAPKATKLKSIMYATPTLSPTAEIMDAIQLIVENGLDAIPLLTKGSVTGVVSESSLMKELLRMKEFGNMPADEAMTKAPLLVKDTDKIMKARQIMNDHNIEHLPVIDKAGNLVGIITEKDLLKPILHQDEFPQFDKKGKKVAEWEAPVKDIMNANVVTVHYKEMIKNALSNSSFNSSIVVVGEEYKPVGIITPKDILELVDIPAEGVYVQISGMQDENGYEKKEANAEVDRTVQKIASTVDVQRLLVHVKRYSEGGKIKYSIRSKLVTDSDVYTSHAHAWDIIRAVGAAMKILEKQVFKKKDKRLDERKHGGKLGAKAKPSKSSRKR